MRLRKLFQFRLSMLLLLVSVVGMALSIVPIRNRYHRQHAALSAIHEMVRHVRTEVPAPNWLVHAVGEECFYDVVHLSLQGAADHAYPGRGFGDDEIPHLANFRQLRRLSLQSTDVTDEGLLYISQLKELDTLSLEMANLAGGGLAHLKDLRKLRDLNLSYCDSANQFHHLAQLTELESLQCGSVSDADLDYIAQLPRLKILKMLSGGFTGQGLSKLNGHANLEELHVAMKHVDVSVADFPKLRHLYVSCFGDRDSAKLRLKNLPQLKSLDRRHVHNIELENVPLLSTSQD